MIRLCLHFVNFRPKGQMEKQFMDSFTDKNIWQLSAIAEEYQKVFSQSLY